MRTRSGADITTDGEVVVKVHRTGTNPRALATRLGIAARLKPADVLLAPVSPRPESVGTRLCSRWPLVQTVAEDPLTIPWPDAGRLLARLHTAAADIRLPHGGPARLRRALDRIRNAHAEILRRAAAALPEVVWRAGSPQRPRTLVHGDFHLGQLGRPSPSQPWVLIDVDDLGVGDPAWDLSRPAGFWAAGLIPDEDWTVFLDSYREAGGPALPPGDPWPVLEPFARAAVVQAAASGIGQPGDETQAALLAACARMPQLEKNSRPKPPLR
jgi:hypothetical protein